MLTGALRIGFGFERGTTQMLKDYHCHRHYRRVVGLLLEQGLMLLARRFSWQDK